MKSTLFIFATLSIMALSCTQPTHDAGDSTDAKVTKAICTLHPTEGNETSGIVSFTKTDTGIVVEAEVNGLTPGKHGFHVHQYGDCSSPDATSAGGHFNPQGTDHAGPHDDMRHVGDLGNLEADTSGYAKLTFVDKKIAFKGENSIIGRGIIVHAGEDDLTSQPTGAAGARVACGVIGIVQEN